jgi:putative spermidine/putrescine transport system substrate-binding protein
MLFNRRHMLQASIGAAAAASLGLPASAQGKPFIVNMFGGRWENDWRNSVLPRFSAQIGRPVNLDIGLGLGWVSNFRAAGQKNPPFSAVMLNERYTAMLRDDGYFETLTPQLVPNLANVIAPARLKDDTAVTGMLAPLIIGYRKDLISKPPRGWADLWDQRFRGQLGLYAITNSAAVMMALWAAEHFGSGRGDIDKAVSKFAELKPFPQLSYSAQLTPLLSQGQIAVAPIDVGEIATMQAQGVPVDYVIPEEGMFVFDHSFSLLKHGADKETGAKYIDFVLSPETQAWMAKNWLIAPTNKTVPLPPEVDRWPLKQEQVSKAIRFDWTEANKLSGALSDAWARKI